MLFLNGLRRINLSKNMKKSLLLLIVLMTIPGIIIAQTTGWKPAGDKIKTVWAEKVDPLNPLPEYPRPQMVRSEWKSLNGLWDYAITPATEMIPETLQGKILVPFAVESSLSGVHKPVGPGNILWYRTKFTVPSTFSKKKILLHFEAVDWSSEIFINGNKVGSHQGGYDPFYFDITGYIKGKEHQILELKVTDPVDKGPQPRGKQVLNPGGIWYTSVTGIWRTVWIEAVPETYISGTIQVPDIDKQILTISVDVEHQMPGDLIRVTATDGDRLVSEKESLNGLGIILPVINPELWSPDNPFLYDMKISVIRKGKVIDEVKSYFAMRKISLQPDENGVLRMMLNNKFTFQYGPLDQGWWPDGLYTAPTDEALLFDIVKTKEMGFNTIRKHVKVEPARWYYYCDKTGIMVWQDMPSGDLGGGRWNDRPGIEGGSDKTRSEESEKIYRTEWNAIIDYLYNFPCIVVWVPFNESWGQFKTTEITKWTMEKDPSRLVNSASGGNFHEVGHILDLHNYPHPVMAKPEIFGSRQALVLGEFGGLGLPLEGHTWLDKNNWGYRTFENADTLFKTYSLYLDRIVPFIKRGLSAAIYTQTTDVEIECNGLMTYDRKVIKMPENQLEAITRKMYEAARTINFGK
jgi:beta-galactosidase/beta-glucuronidase